MAQEDLALSFSRDYAAARARFRAAAQAARFELAEYPIDARGPDGGALTIDVARRGSARPRATLVVSSGTHGVEGFFGSAVQLAALERLFADEMNAEQLAVVLIHAVNPYGFAWRRRVNEDNVDLNRNFMLEGRAFAGAPEAYRRLDPLLNPPTPPSLIEPFWIKAGVELVRHGFSSLKNAVAQGQYDFPMGLFFGGKGPTKTQRIFAEHVREWVGEPERVLHVDFHTGLGPWASYTLALDLPSTHPRIAQLGREFGAHAVQGFEPSGTLYEIQGGLGSWLEQQFPNLQYDCLLAEFGTYSPVRVLAAMRTENRAHHYGQANPALVERAKQDLLEVFCPASEAWRRTVARRGLRVVEQALTTLTNAPERRLKSPVPVSAPPT